MSWCEITHPDDGAQEQPLEEQMRANRRDSYRIKKRFLPSDGPPIWMDVSVSCTRKFDGTVDFFIGQGVDITDQVAAQEALAQRASTDSLTGLLNREEVFQQIEQQLRRQRRREGDQLAVLFCDLDHFKEVNDSCGHQAGDAVLEEMARRLRSCLRSSDLAARIGGDELVVVLTEVGGQAEAMAIAEKLRQLALEPVPTLGGLARVSLSVGVALALPGEDLDGLLARADAAMYEAKRRGRNQVVRIDEEPA